LTVQQAQRQLRAFAEHARRDIAAAARRRSVEWSFAVVHGAPGAEMTGAAAGDFLVACTATRPIGGHFRLECRWWSAVEPKAASFLLATRQGEQTGSVVVLLRNREPVTDRLLDAAAQLAEAGGGRLTVICPSELGQAEGFAAWLGERLAAYTIPVEIDMAPADPAALIGRIVELEGQLVAIAADDPQARPANLRQLVARSGCDVLVVR
jgi:hypothetical protein